jgi:putative chitinase
LNVAADANNIRTITKRINGGVNGLAGRKVFFAQLLPLLQTNA